MQISWGKGRQPPTKTRVPGISYGEKNSENFNRLCKVHQRHRRQTTHRIAIAYSERNVVTFAKN